METVTAVLLLLGAVVVSGFVARIRAGLFPLPLVQVGIGVAIDGFLGMGLSIDPELFFLLFLPPLLFLDGWRISKDDVVRYRSVILGLALGLVALTVFGVGYLLNWLAPAMPLGVAFALAAVISPTDPVAVAAISARAKIPERLMHILEGEALLNDASGLVCMRFAVAAVLTGGFSLGDAIGDFVWLASGGLGIGVVVTLVVTRVKWLRSFGWAKRQVLKS
ncbi:cation:proton antiporter [Chenggangzhangella methanolivorans]|uniref:cation:proton antiporter domain-containing protein n=1 Tax=Chenggangzhangella methanolivorans TaxID=1437009 RepID=UPI0028F419A3|nr:cation:proton antiporter [Chenggangzhangella methanolivorans]